MIQKFQYTEEIFVPPYENRTLNLKDFIKENFQIPDNDLERIVKFIGQDSQLEKIIFELPSLIGKEISYDNLQMKFYDEFQKDYLQLEVNILTSMDIKSALKVEDKLERQLYESYKSDLVDKLLIIMV